MPSSSYLRAGQTFGNLQHAPHRMHFPTLFLLTGKIAVNVRKILENQLFFIQSPQFCLKLKRLYFLKIDNV